MRTLSPRARKPALRSPVAQAARRPTCRCTATTSSRLSERPGRLGFGIERRILSSSISSSRGIPVMARRTYCRTSASGCETARTISVSIMSLRPCSREVQKPYQRVQRAHGGCIRASERICRRGWRANRMPARTCRRPRRLHRSHRHLMTSVRACSPASVQLVPVQRQSSPACRPSSRPNGRSSRPRPHHRAPVQLSRH